MKSRSAYLKQRRKFLLSQAAVQRSELPFITQDLQQHLFLVDMGFVIVKVMREHPALTLATATLLFPARQNKLVLWSRKLFAAWELFALVSRQWRNSSKSTMKSV